MKKLQLKQIANRVSLAVRRVKGKRGEQITAKDVKQDAGAKLVKLDDGYEIFKTTKFTSLLSKEKAKCFRHDQTTLDPNMVLLVVSRRYEMIGRAQNSR